jgi:ABC-type antimicrobial peptide transport system permease subunit
MRSVWQDVRYGLRLLRREPGFAVAAAGLAVGLALAFAAVRVWSTLLYGVSTYDGWSVAIVPVVLGLVTAVACVLPARRAARIDPLTVLRST